MPDIPAMRRFQPARLPLALLSGTLALAGCGAGDGSGLNANGRPLDEASALALDASFESIQANVLSVSCASAGCHQGAAAAGGLDLSEGSALANLVGVPSGQQPGLLRVAPGDPDASYLVRKLEGAGGISGQRMPRNGPPYLDDAVVQVVRQWIAAGATGGGLVNAAPPPRVASTEPAAGATVTALPAQVLVRFDQAMDAATLADLTVAVQASGGDGGFADGNETTLTPADLALDAATQRVLTIDLAGSPDQPDDYRLLLSGSGPAVVRNAEAVVLDGDGDGSAGGDFSSGFTVDPNALVPTLDSLQARLFTPTCALSGCHAGPNPQAGLNLQAGQSYASLVGVRANLQPALLRVEPGNPDDSWIVQALEGTDRFRAFMPAGNPGSVPSATLAVLRAWISAGADP